jgi:hypothetical protein
MVRRGSAPCCCSAASLSDDGLDISEGVVRLEGGTSSCTFQLLSQIRAGPSQAVAKLVISKARASSQAGSGEERGTGRTLTRG